MKKFRDKIFRLIIFLFTFLSIVPLFLILFIIAKKGISSISIDFFTKLPPPPGESNGGVVNSILGSLEVLFFASLFSLPLGVLVGLLLAEVEASFINILRIMVNALQGIPSIVIGIFGYIVMVKAMKGFSLLSGSFSLSLMMLPLIIKNTEETIKLIPYSLREASYSLGANYTKTIFKVILPEARNGIIQGILTAVSRVLGETAPLLFTAFGNPYINLNPLKPVDALPLLIFNFSMSPYDNWHKLAWGASLFLIVLIFLTNIFVKGVKRK